MSRKQITAKAIITGMHHDGMSVITTGGATVVTVSAGGEVKSETVKTKNRANLNKL